MDFTKREEKEIRLYFELSVWLKGLVSAAEVVGGLLVLVVPISTLTSVVINYAANELAEDPNDFIASHVGAWAHQLVLTGSGFIALYLLSRGIIKLGLVVALLKNQLWAYPASLAVLGLFMLYQLYQIAMGHSLFIVMLTLFDAVVMWSIWKEYEVMRAHLHPAGR